MGLLFNYARPHILVPIFYISVVTFLTCHGVTFLIPGDIEQAGWERLLLRESFRSSLINVDVFIASHHGRENSYCERAFNYCSPNVIVFSDGSKIHTTQEMTNTYARHASGVTFNGETRYVLTTRNDGAIWWDL